MSDIPIPPEPSILGTSGDFGSSSDTGVAKPARSGSNMAIGLMKALADPRLAQGVKVVKELLATIKDSKSGATPSNDNRFSNAIGKAQGIVNSTSFNNFMGGMGGMGGGGKAGMYGAAANAGLQLGSAVIGGIDKRVDNMYGKALTYDKLSTLYQQTQNISQNQFSKNYIDPLMASRLGQGGAATLLSLQSQTGLKANINASSVAALQAATGYAYNTTDMARMMATMASPAVNNRMTMTMGTGMYGIGGKQNSMMSVIQQVVKSSGLTNAQMAQSAMQQGSISRARLSALGLPEDMQNMVLQYAQENINFQKKGGKGMYDPSKAADQKLMGIDKNFATQQQETMRVSEKRDAQFYKRQADNYGRLEKNTQGLIKAFGALEDKMSGAIGARMNTRNSRTGAIAKGIGGIALMAGGAALSEFGIGIPMMAAGVGLTASAFQGFSGDPMPGHNHTKVSVGYSGKKKSIGEVNASSTVSKLNTTFRDRIMKMVQDNPNVGIGQGFRSTSEQRNLFLSRYTKTDEKTGIFWEGAHWKKNQGVADAAPPGVSMHEIGLAADLTGDIAWVQKNAAKYGLKTFAGVNNEPWHVQPAELPNDRYQYEKGGAKWGLGGGSPMDPKTKITGMTDGVISDRFSGASSGKGGIPTMSQVSIMDSISMSREMNRAGLNQVGGGTSAGGVSKAGLGKNNSSGTGSSGPLNPQALASMLYKAGFRGDDLAKAIAIAQRESHMNPRSLNNNSATGDLSYGLYQINMKGSLGTSRRKSQNLPSNDALYDPETNIRVMRNMYNWNKGHGRDPFYDWGPYKNKPAIYGAAQSYYPKAQAIAKATQGDPMPQHRGGGSASVNIDGGGTITIAPNININSSGAGVDAHKVAQEAARIIERELKVAMMRKN